MVGAAPACVVEVADGCGAERDGDAVVGADGNVVHVEEGLETVEAGEVDGGRAAEERNAVAAGVDCIDAHDLNGERGDAGKRGVGADDKGGTADNLWIGCVVDVVFAPLQPAARRAAMDKERRGARVLRRICNSIGSLLFLRCPAMIMNGC